MSKKIIYKYDPFFFTFQQEAEARPDPLEKNRWLIPACATDKKPPAVDEGYIPVFNEKDQKWEIKENHYGEIMYDTVTGEPVTIDFFGEIPEGYTLKEKPGPDFYWVPDLQNWFPDIKTYRENKKKTLLNQKNVENFSPLFYKDYELICTQEVQLELSLIASSYSSSSNETFYLLDTKDQLIEFNIKEIKNINKEIIKRAQLLKQNYLNVLNRLEKSKSVEEIQKLSI